MEPVTIYFPIPKSISKNRMRYDLVFRCITFLYLIFVIIQLSEHDIDGDFYLVLIMALLLLINSLICLSYQSSVFMLRNYFKINDEVIEYKLRDMLPGKQIRWRSIERIEFRDFHIWIYLRSTVYKKINIQSIPLRYISSIKKKITEYAKVKGIKVI